MYIEMYVGTSFFDHPVTSCNDAASAGTVSSIPDAVAKSVATPHLRVAIHRARPLFRPEDITAFLGGVSCENYFPDGSLADSTLEYFPRPFSVTSIDEVSLTQMERTAPYLLTLLRQVILERAFAPTLDIEGTA